VLRSELCDGPRAVAHARIILAEVNPTADTVTRGIERVKSDLARSLVPPEPDEPIQQLMLSTARAGLTSDETFRQLGRDLTEFTTLLPGAKRTERHR
jgi:hypothetical protein